MGDCERCGAVPAQERHHQDGNEHNNEQSNVLMVCRSCHRELDGRSQRKWEISPTARPCVICGRTAEIRSRGRCNRCAEFLRRTGREWNE